MSGRLISGTRTLTLTALDRPDTSRPHHGQPHPAQGQSWAALVDRSSLREPSLVARLIVISEPDAGEMSLPTCRNDPVPDLLVTTTACDSGPLTALAICRGSVTAEAENRLSVFAYENAGRSRPTLHKS